MGERGEERNGFGGVRVLFQQGSCGIEIGVGIAGGLREGVEEVDCAGKVVGVKTGIGEGEVVGGLESMRRETTVEDELEYGAGIFPAAVDGQFFRGGAEVAGGVFGVRLRAIVGQYGVKFAGVGREDDFSQALAVEVHQ